MSRERMRLKREAMASLTATSPAAMLQAEQERLACQAQQFGLATGSPAGTLYFGWSVHPPSQYGVQTGGTYSSTQMPQGMAQYNVQSAMIAHGAYPQMQSASLPHFDGAWNSCREESVGVEDTEVPIRMLATHGATGGLPVERVHDILHCDAATNFRTFGPKSGGGAKVMVDGKDVGSRLTKADFAVPPGCALTVGDRSETENLRPVLSRVREFSDLFLPRSETSLWSPTFSDPFWPTSDPSIATHSPGPAT